MRNNCIIKKIGEGSFSQIYQETETSSHKVYALKILKQEFNSFFEVNNLREICSLKHLLKHPNTIEIHDAIFKGN
jgi:serine/threonine protein kinase